MRRRGTERRPGSATKASRTAAVAAVAMVAIAGLLATAGLAGCGGSEEPAATRPTDDADGATDEPTEEEVEARIRAAAILERQRETLVDELVALAADGSTSARDVMMLVPRDAPPRLFPLDESALVALDARERTDVIARYDRLALGLKALARRAVDEASALADAGRPAEGRDLLVRVRDLAEASAGEEVAEIGRDAARLAIGLVDEGLAELPPAAGGGTGGGEDAGEAQG